jgi:hypothetical protein|tara:strand:+ start:9504 stop:10589 length:1086 start_codon:yes stop_codon:yes gene_type:complete
MGAITTIAIGLGSAGLSFAQASKAAEDNRKANRQAAKEMAKLKDRAAVKFTDKLSLNTDLYEQQFEQNLQVNADLVNAAREAGPREVAALAGRIGASQTAANEAVRLSQTDRLQEIETLQMGEQSEINQQLLAIETAQLQDKSARDAQTRQVVAGATMSGINSLTNMATTLAKSTPENPLSKDKKALKNTLDKNNISYADYTANPDQYKNLFFNADGSPLEDGLMSLGTLPAGLEMPKSSVNKDGSDPVIQNTLDLQQRQLNQLTDMDAGLSPNGVGAFPGSGLSDKELRDRSIAEMNYNTGPNPNNIIGQQRNSMIQGAGGSLAPPPTTQDPNMGIPGYVPLPQVSYDDILLKYGIKSQF